MKHQNISVFHMGHFEHSDFKCQKVASEFPPKGFFISKLFEKKEHMPKLRVLFLEQSCDLTPFLVPKINKSRPEIRIFESKTEALLGESLDVDDEDSDG